MTYVSIWSMWPMDDAAAIIKTYGYELSREQVLALAGPTETSWSRRVADSYEAQSYEHKTGEPF